MGSSSQARRTTQQEEEEEEEEEDQQGVSKEDRQAPSCVYWAGTLPPARFAPPPLKAHRASTPLEPAKETGQERSGSGTWTSNRPKGSSRPQGS